MWWCGSGDIPRALGKGRNGDWPLPLLSVNIKIVYWSKLGFTAASQTRWSRKLFPVCFFPFPFRTTQPIVLHQFLWYTRENILELQILPNKASLQIWYRDASLPAVDHSEQHSSWHQGEDCKRRSLWMALQRTWEEIKKCGNIWRW